MAAAHAAWSRRSVIRRVAQAPLRRVSGGRLFAPQYADGAPVADALVEQQGPNYALAKRLQRWRGVRAAADGHTVSFNVAPAAWTRSVTKNRMLAAAYAQAHAFGIEIFAPDTCRVLMAALLVHDLHHPPARDRHPRRCSATAPSTADSGAARTSRAPCSASRRWPGCRDAQPLTPGPVMRRTPVGVRTYTCHA